MALKKIVQKLSFWEIIGFNLLPLILVYTGTIEFYYFLIYFVFEVVFVGLFSVVKWFCFFKGSAIISRLISSILFMGITLTLYGLAALFVMAMAKQFYPENGSRIDIIDLLYDAKYLIAVTFVRILIYHIKWVRNKEYYNTTLMKQFYIMVISGFGGLLVFLGTVNYMGKQIEDQPELMATLFTVVVIAFELWNKFDPKKWLKAG